MASGSLNHLWARSEGITSLRGMTSRLRFNMTEPKDADRSQIAANEGMGSSRAVRLPLQRSARASPARWRCVSRKSIVRGTLRDLVVTGVKE
jgi:hypothetical protein